MKTLETRVQAPAPAVPPGPRRVRRAVTGLARAAGLTVVFLVTVCVLWEVVKLVSGTNDNLMPHSWAIFATLLEPASTGGTWFSYIATNWLVTLRNAVSGFLVGTLFGVLLGIWIASSRAVGAALLPITALMQTIPIVAIAPALVVFLGTGTLSKMFISAFLTFFPVTVATAKGIASTRPESLELMRVCASSRSQTLLKMELPSALPYIFVGLETAAGISVIGAIVAELPFGATGGLGMVILSSWQFYLFQPEPLYLAALAAAALGAVVVFSVRGVRALVPAASEQIGAAT